MCVRESVCEREIECVGESASVWERERVRVCGRERECECVGERECECMGESVWERESV